MCLSEVVLKWTWSALSLSLSLSSFVLSACRKLLWLVSRIKTKLKYGRHYQQTPWCFSFKSSTFSLPHSFLCFFLLWSLHLSLLLPPFNLLLPNSFFLCSTSPCLCLCPFLYLVLVCWVLAMCSGHLMATASASNRSQGSPTIPHAKCPNVHTHRVKRKNIQLIEIPAQQSVWKWKTWATEKREVGERKGRWKGYRVKEKINQIKNIESNRRAMK